MRCDRSLGQVARRGPIIVRGEGCFVFDSEDARYIDLFASAGTILLGHNDPEFLETISLQTSRIIGNAYRSELRERYVLELTPHLPQHFDEAIFLSTGGEAVEAALQIAQLVTGRRGVIRIGHAYHGRGVFARHVSSSRFVGTHYPPVISVATVPWTLIEQSTSENRFLELLDRFLHMSKLFKPAETACVIIEPIQGTAGNRPVPSHVLSGLSKFCHSNGSMYVIDECLTGGGRTGKVVDTSDIALNADFLLMGKGIANGLPMAILFTRTEIVDFVCNKYGLGFSTSFGGNLLSISAAIATLEIIMRRNLVPNAAAVGEYFRQKLVELMDQFGLPLEIQGRGLMLGYNWPQIGTKKESHRLFQSALGVGLYGIFQNEFVRINPSLTFSPNLVEDSTARLKSILTNLPRDLVDGN